MNERSFFHTTDEVPQLRTRPPTAEVEPLAPDRGHLAVVIGTAAGRSFAIQRDPVIIGRTPECGAWIPEPDVSRRHARIEHRGGHFTLVDLGSRNGTRVNGTSFTEHVLENGDIITLAASTVLVFSRHDPLGDSLLHLQKNEVVGRLAGGVAHDFNELVTAVLNNVQCLEEGCTDPGEYRDSLAEIRHAAQRGAELARRLLDFARRGPRWEGEVDLSALVEDAVALCERTFGAVSLRLSVEPRLKVRGDRLQLFQALMNLLVNARDAAGPEGWIGASVARVGPEVEVTISDSGAGMDPATRAQAFEPFHSQKPGGSGLGLSTTRGIVSSHGGRIAIHSSPGQGTRVRLMLPLVGPRPTRQPTAESTPVKGCILVVDDDELSRKSLVRLLRARGYEIVEARDGMAAVEVFAHQQARIDLVLLDQVMPRMGGPEAFRRLRAIDPGLQVLLISGYEEQESIQRLLDQGAAGFLPKPISSSLLDQQIAAALRSRDKKQD